MKLSASSPCARTAAMYRQYSTEQFW